MAAIIFASIYFNPLTELIIFPIPIPIKGYIFGALYLFYSYYLSGIYDTTTKTADAFVVEDVLPPEGFTVAYVRFVNASSTTQPMTLYAKNRTTLEEVAIGGLVPYKSAGAFVALPVGFVSGSYDLSTRTEGSATNVFTRSQVSFFPGRAYTITARGNTASTSTMFLDNTANR